MDHPAVDLTRALLWTASEPANSSAGHRECHGGTSRLTKVQGVALICYPGGCHTYGFPWVYG